MNSKMLFFPALCAAIFPALADLAPVVSDVTMTQPAESRKVTITYRLANAPAIVTLDVQTNKTGAATSVESDWVSIGGENVQHVSGDVWKEVAAGDDVRTITWRADKSWSGRTVNDIRAKVTAWSLDNPPDYLVVDVSATGGAGTERYYSAAEFLPGGLLANEDYRLGKIVLRKIAADGVKWQMGTAKTEVAMAGSYYIGVFEVTQTQYELVQGEYAVSGPSNRIERAMRPVENVCYNEIRLTEHAKSASVADYNYPAAPNPKSYLGLLRTKTGLLFDLPGEAQWEFACRAGNGEGSWGDGTSTSDAENLDALARYNDKVTAVVGSYKPNDWGLYDMHGNVWEFCLDFYAKSIASLKGAVNTTTTLNGAYVRKGGGYSSAAAKCVSANRGSSNANTSIYYTGFRLALPIPSKVSE